MSDNPRLLLKWGTLKGWGGLKKDSPAHKALLKYHDEPVFMGAMQHKDTESQKQALCDLIDAVCADGGEVQSDWSGEIMSADEAKRYVREYGGGADE